MPTLTIPPRHRAGLNAIQVLSKESLKQLIDALSNVPFSMNPTTIAASVGSHVPVIQGAELARIIDAVLALYVVRASGDIPMKVFVNDIAHAMSDTSESEAAFANVNIPSFKRKLTALLEIDALSTVSKAVGLRSDYPNTFCDVKVLTDIRPVFGLDVKAPPAGAIVTHTLKIEYHHGAAHAEFYVGLDDRELANMITVLERAKQKSATIKTLLKKTSLADLEVE